MAYVNMFRYFVQIILGTFHVYGIVSAWEIKGKLPDPSVIVRIFNDYLHPRMRSLPINDEILKSKESEVNKIIREKVEDLLPLLQDNDVTVQNENIMFDGEDDTTIIEFLPKTEEKKKIVLDDDTFKNHLKKYKKIRDNINKVLTKEAVSKKTKKFVIKTLDDLIRSLLGSQCKWKRNLRALKSENPSSLATKWNRGLQEIKGLILNFFKSNSTNSRRHDDDPTFLNSIQALFRSVAEDFDTISKKYKILCDFVPKYQNLETKYSETNSSALRNNWDKTDLEEDRCQNIVVCSNELKEFMRSFYQALNETTVSVLKNYAEMYIRDINFDSENEKDVLISVLNKITNVLEDSISKIFIKETKNMNLDKGKNKYANIKALSNYVIYTVESVKDGVKDLLKKDLPLLRDKILLIIMDDINVNLDVDLGNLEREFVRKICVIFRLCNDKYIGRRQGSSSNKNNLYVQVQLTFDDNMTDINLYRRFMKTVSPKNSTVDRFHFMTNVTVTRTTLKPIP